MVGEHVLYLVLGTELNCDLQPPQLQSNGIARSFNLQLQQLLDVPGECVKQEKNPFEYCSLFKV